MERDPYISLSNQKRWSLECRTRTKEGSRQTRVKTITGKDKSIGRRSQTIQMIKIFIGDKEVIPLTQWKIKTPWYRRVYYKMIKSAKNISNKLFI